MSLSIRRSAASAVAHRKGATGARVERGQAHSQTQSKSHAQGKEKGKGGRYFDSHTISIYAHNIVQRGGSPQAAVQMIMNRLDQGKAKSTSKPSTSTSLYNSALHICGQKAMMGQASKILQKMVARNVPTNERTISSLLNAIANSFQRGTLIVPSEAEKKETEAETEETDSTNVDQFKVKSAEDGVKLAVKLYASWTEHCLRVEKRGRLPVQPFNALLKVLFKCGVEGGKVLEDIFPLEGTKSDWIPTDLDIITFTTAIHTCNYVVGSFEMASKYWNTYLEQHEKQVDSQFISAIMLVLRNDLRTNYRNGIVQLTRDQILSRRAVIEKALSLSTTLTQSSSNSDPTLLNNLLLDNCVLLGVYDGALNYWNNNIKGTINYDHQTITSLLQIMRRKKLYSEGLQEWTAIKGGKVKISMNVGLLNVLLVLCRLAGQRSDGLKLVDQFVKNGKVPLTIDTAYYSILLATEDDLYLTELIKYFRGSDIWPTLSQKNYVKSLLLRKQLN